MEALSCAASLPVSDRFLKFSSGYTQSQALWNKSGITNKIKALAVVLLELVRNALVFVPNLCIFLANRISPLRREKPPELESQVMEAEQTKSDELLVKNEEPPKSTTSAGSSLLASPTSIKPICAEPKPENLLKKCGACAANVWSFVKNHPIATVAGVIGLGGAIAVLGAYGPQAIVTTITSAPSQLYSLIPGVSAPLSSSTGAILTKSPDSLTPLPGIKDLFLGFLSVFSSAKGFSEGTDDLDEPDFWGGKEVLPRESERIDDPDVLPDVGGEQGSTIGSQSTDNSDEVSDSSTAGPDEVPDVEREQGSTTGSQNTDNSDEVSHIEYQEYYASWDNEYWQHVQQHEDHLEPSRENEEDL